MIALKLQTVDKVWCLPTRQRGTAVIELAITLLFLLLLTVGITEIGRAFWYYSAVQKSVRDGARCMSNLNWVDTVSVTGCQDLVVGNANSSGLQPVLVSGNVTLAWACDGSPTCASSWGSGGKPEYVTVTATHQMRWLWSIGGLPAAGQSSGLRVVATMPYMK